MATVVENLSLSSQLLGQPLFTCLSCSIAFHSAEEQRIHYRSDHHRYNMKRRVASLPPVSTAVFNQKVFERRAETAVVTSAKGTNCDVCSKAYTTENAYRSHIISKKHKDNENMATLRPKPQPPIEEAQVNSALPIHASPSPNSQGSAQPEQGPVHNDASDDEDTQTIDQKIAAARSRLPAHHCLFCTHESESLGENLFHMSSTHSFFIPDADYLVDITGLISYLGDKVAVGNVCIYCNDKGREFRSLSAVRKHMVDKSHCKIAYDSEDDRLEVSEFYDFTSSYPVPERRKKPAAMNGNDREVCDEWEDIEGDDDGNSVDEVVKDADDSKSDSDSDGLPENQVTYGDSHLELVLPSGARIGHRSLRRYYTQNFLGAPHGKPEDPNSGAALVRRLLADKNSALVPRKGGFGAFGSGMDVVKARNRGEAREAGRHVREFRDQKRREEFKTKIGFIGNHQKHFRDPLLQ